MPPEIRGNGCLLLERAKNPVNPESIAFPMSWYIARTMENHGKAALLYIGYSSSFPYTQEHRHTQWLPVCPCECPTWIQPRFSLLPCILPNWLCCITYTLCYDNGQLLSECILDIILSSLSNNNVGKTVNSYCRFQVYCF